MSIPDFQTIMRPLLFSISDGIEHDLKEIKRVLVAEFKIKEDELRIKIPSQRAFLFDNRLGWANTYLKKAGLITSQRRGYLQITDSGKRFLNDHKEQIKVADLKKIEQFKSFHKIKSKTEETIQVDEISIEDTNKSPEEIIDSAYDLIFNGLVVELLSTIKSCSPLFFEKLVIDLLLTMGYGGSRKEAGTAIGKSGDGGIDGIINEDKLGLDSIYLQAKRWENTVPIKEIRDFAGSLLSKKAKKGVFITTSDFPKSAYDYVNSIEPKIILIDGERLASLMIEHNVGVTIKDSFIIKDIDNDYFEET
jgi:restriction system protein